MGLAENEAGNVWVLDLLILLKIKWGCSAISLTLGLPSPMVLGWGVSLFHDVNSGMIQLSAFIAVRIRVFTLSMLYSNCVMSQKK